MSPVSVDSLDIYNTFILFPSESSFVQFPMVYGDFLSLPISCYAVFFGSHTNMPTISEKNLWFCLASSTSFLCVSFFPYHFNHHPPTWSRWAGPSRRWVGVPRYRACTAINEAPEAASCFTSFKVSWMEQNAAWHDMSWTAYWERCF